MESLSKQELISTITKQADQIRRLETRLRDVVTAYKGLVKEKEALEISLKALNRTEVASEGVPDDSMAALSLSLSTLTAEKARMEEAFQADKKVTREKYENMLVAMKEETRTLVQQHIAEVNNLKAKISYEIQERENERADHSAMMKELHIKLNSERKTKEKLEDKVVHSNESQASQADLEKRVRDLSSALEAARRRQQRAEARAVETPALLVRLQQKLALLEQSHAVAIREEQIKVKRAEEAARKQSARHEERAGALEARLAELSATLGQYHRRRDTDHHLIHQLKEKLNDKLMNVHRDADGDKIETVSEDSQLKSETDNDKLADTEYLQTLIDKIHILKKEFIAENDKLGCPLDITSVFKVEGYEMIHQKCKQEIETLRTEYETYKSKHTIIDNSSGVIEDLQNEVTILKAKLGAYSIMLEEEKQDKADKLRMLEEEAKKEAEYQAEARAELRARALALEEQLSAQRTRAAALLRDADSRARAAPPAAPAAVAVPDVTAPPHMLHYAHELARKDLDISQLRKDKHILEGQFRDCQREATIEKERFKEVIRTLKVEIDRLRRIQSREGANLEYLKNVVMAYLMSTDYAGRKHMLNAIAAVLHFTNTEKNLVLSML